MSKLRPSPAMAVALLALFISLAGTAFAAPPIVARARYALNAGNSAKLQGKTPPEVAALALGGQTPEQLAAMPSPTSSIAGLVTLRRAGDVMNSQAERAFTVGCPTGEKVIGGGWRGEPSNRDVIALEDAPNDAGTAWTVYLWNGHRNSSRIEVFAICVK